MASTVGPVAGALTTSVAALVVVVPNAFVNFAPNFVPLCAVVVAGVVYEPDVAPEIGENEVAPGASENHCTVGAAQFAGVEPTAMNVAAAGAVTVSADGCNVIDGAAEHTAALTV